jgi:hypothetical protein
MKERTLSIMLTLKSMASKSQGKLARIWLVFSYFILRIGETHSEGFQGGANIAFGGREMSFSDNYYIL